MGSGGRTAYGVETEELPPNLRAYSLWGPFRESTGAARGSRKVCMAEVGIGVLLWFILAALGGVLVCCHSVVYHLLRSHAAQCRGFADFQHLSESIQNTIQRVNAGLVQVHERYLILQRDVKYGKDCRAGKYLFGPPGHGVSSAVDGLSRSLPPGGNLDLTEEQDAKLTEALRLTKEVRDSGVGWKSVEVPGGGWPPHHW